MDPSGHCGAAANINPLIGIFNIFRVIDACGEAFDRTRDSIDNGETRPLALLAHVTGITDALISATSNLETLNADVAAVFSDAPLEDRIPAAINVGVTSVSTAATVIGIYQLASAGIRSIKMSNRTNILDEFGNSVTSVSDDLASNQSPSFVVTRNGEVIPVPRGATGPLPTRNNRGFQYLGGSGGNGLHPNVSSVRIMDGNRLYPTGYVVYGNAAGQTVSPITAQPLSYDNPLAHIVIKLFAPE